MEITTRIPSPRRLLRPGWRWGLLPLLAVALALMSAHESAPRAGAVLSSILIGKIDRGGGQTLADACFSVRNTSQVQLFNVCDNDFQGPPDKNVVCTAALNQCSDAAPSVDGAIAVLVAPGTYHVVEIKAPPGYNLKPGKQVCVVVTLGCSNVAGLILVFLDDLVPAGDYDNDGCTNAQEVGIDQRLGGRRNPKNFWDFPDMFNPTRDKTILINDVSAVIQRYRANDANGTALINRNSPPLTTAIPATGYHPIFDHTYVGPNGWNLGPPDGQILIEDVSNVMQQYRYHCN